MSCQASWGSTGIDDLWSGSSCLWVNSNRRKEQREVERTQRAKKLGKKLKEWPYSAAWTNWCLFSATTQCHTCTYGVFLHYSVFYNVLCYLCSSLYLQLQHMLAYQVSQMMQILFWTLFWCRDSPVPPCLCWSDCPEALMLNLTHTEKKHLSENIPLLYCVCICTCVCACIYCYINTYFISLVAE